MNWYWKLLNYLGLTLGIGLMVFAVYSLPGAVYAQFLAPLAIILYVALFLAGVYGAKRSLKNIKNQK